MKPPPRRAAPLHEQDGCPSVQIRPCRPCRATRCLPLLCISIFPASLSFSPARPSVPTYNFLHWDRAHASARGRKLPSLGSVRFSPQSPPTPGASGHQTSISLCLRALRGTNFLRARLRRSNSTQQRAARPAPAGRAPPRVLASSVWQANGVAALVRHLGAGPGYRTQNKTKRVSGRLQYPEKNNNQTHLQASTAGSQNATLGVRYDESQKSNFKFKVLSSAGATATPSAGVAGRGERRPASSRSVCVCLGVCAGLCSVRRGGRIGTSRRWRRRAGRPPYSWWQGGRHS